MVDKTFSGGDKLEKKLREIAEKAGKANVVQVGFLSDATYPDGTSVAMVAAINEFGGTVTVPAHEVTINRKIKESGEFAAGGQFVKAEKANFATTHMVESYTVTIPPRPFFRGMVSDKSGEWGPALGKIIRAANYESSLALARLGKHIGEQLQDSIREFDSPENAKSTIAKKGFNKPLVDSGNMLRSVDFEVKDE
jgi:hypothetical protein